MTDTTEGVQAGTALSVQRMPPDVWAMIKEQSQTLEAAGKNTSILPKGITNRYQVAAILQKGWELGFSPMYALEQIALVNGRPVVQGQALLALIQAHHGRKAVQVLKTDDKACTVRFRDPSDPDAGELEVTWTIDDAQQAGLLNKPGPWKQYPRAMLRWRAISEGARIFFADTIGGLRLPDEMGLPVAVEEATGNLIIDQEALEREEAPEQQATDIADAELAQAGEAPVKHNRQELMEKMEGSLRELAEARGKGEQWLFVLRQVASNLGFEAKGPSTLDDEGLIKVTEEAREQIQKLQEAKAEEAPQTIAESIPEHADEVVPQPEEAPADMTW